MTSLAARATQSAPTVAAHILFYPNTTGSMYVALNVTLRKEHPSHSVDLLVFYDPVVDNCTCQTRHGQDGRSTCNAVQEVQAAAVAAASGHLRGPGPWRSGTLTSRWRYVTSFTDIIWLAGCAVWLDGCLAGRQTGRYKYTDTDHHSLCSRTSIHLSM